jgi:protein ImuB
MMDEQARRRILHVWLPFLGTDRIDRLRHQGVSRSARETPLVTVERTGGTLLIAAVDARAARAGLQPGLTLAQARAQFPDLAVEEADHEAEARTLHSLATAAGRYTPFVGLDPPAGLFLDITGCAHLFGGEAALLEDLVARFDRWGFSARAAIADEPGAAWGVARYGPGGIVPPDRGLGALETLPVAALRLPADSVATLDRLGLKTVQLLLQQPRKALVRRFGPEVARRIDQASGRESEPITPLAPVPPLLFERRLAEPIAQVEVIAKVLRTLAERLCRALRERGEGARRLTVTLFTTDGTAREAGAGSSEPIADEDRMLAILEPKIQIASGRIESDSGIDLVRLAARETETMPERQATIDGAERLRADLARLVDTLAARLGEDAVMRLVPQDSHQPAEADRRVPVRNALDPPPWQTHERATRPACHALPTRPLRIFDPPEQVETLAGVPDGPPLRFVWRRVTHHVAAAEGPERIAPSWWDAPPEEGLSCDYFRVEDTRGRRFWMFRRGLYGRETREAQWYVHGVFA